MIIKENGFYDLSNYLDSEVIIEDGIVVAIYDSGNVSRKIFLKQKSFLQFFSFLTDEKNHTIEFFQKEENSKLEVRYLLFSKDETILKSRIYSKIESSFSKSDVKIFSIIGEKGFIDLDGVIEISPNIEKVSGHLVEENLFLGHTGKMKGIPTLLVRSDDVEASHACRIEKISEKNLFYLKSRGIQEKTAYYLLLEANIKSLFSCLSMINNSFYESLLFETTSKITGNFK
ncbi:SufD family Fe-S cluster assembly protein [Candidatus Gracilibacteria bacterium]|nr:SufD family Fe-S cluster assembly protein [Candidatus Gracilibacteria bacterium]